MCPRERHPGCQRCRLLLRAPGPRHRPPQLCHAALELGRGPLEPDRRRLIQATLDVRGTGDATPPRRPLGGRPEQLPLDPVGRKVTVADGARADAAPPNEAEPPPRAPL